MSEKIRLGATPYPFKPSGGVSLACTSTTGSTALSGTGDQVLVTNTGLVPVHVAFGAAAITATTASQAILPMSQVLLTLPEVSSGVPATYVAGITASGSATIQVSTGLGL